MLITQKLVGYVLLTLTLALLLLSVTTKAHAVVRIAGDRGGLIGTYTDRYLRLQTSGETVMIDGLCASACTMVLGYVPYDKICVTPRAQLGFHSAYNIGLNGKRIKVAIINPDATAMLYSMYPSPIKDWIMNRGGLPSPKRLAILEGAELNHLYRPCNTAFNAHARRLQ